MALPLHISLSIPLIFRTEKREAFLDQLTHNVRATSVRPFKAVVHSYGWHPNHDATRWFFVLKLTRPPKDELNFLLDACNRTAAASEQPTLYLAQQSREKNSDRPQKESRGDTEGPSAVPDCTENLHISLAWSLKPPPHPASTVEGFTASTFKDLSLEFEDVKVKIGNVVHSIALSANAKAFTKGGRSILGS